MTSFGRDTEQLRAIMSEDWVASEAPVPAAIVLLHGYGSNEHDLAGLPDALGVSLPWSSLRAPIQLGNGGAAWFAITAPGDPDSEALDRATNAIWDWADAHVPAQTKVIPIGFSQGGLMASQLLRTRPDRVMAPVVLGGFVGRPAQSADEALLGLRPPAFWGRGSEDRMITAAAVERTAQFLPAHSSLVERVYPGLGHGISRSELDDVRKFLVANVGPTGEIIAKAK